MFALVALLLVTTETTHEYLARLYACVVQTSDYPRIRSHITAGPQSTWTIGNSGDHRAQSRLQHGGVASVSKFEQLWND